MAFTGVTAFPYEMTPLTNTAPFTYRDGTTYLEILNRIERWLNDVLVADSNAAIANAIAEFQAGIKNAEDRVIETEEMHQALVTGALASVAESVTNLTAFVNGEVIDLTSYVNTETANAKTYVDNAIQFINNKTGNVQIQRQLLTANYTVTIDPLWPNNHPVNFQFIQDATGGRTLIPGPNVVGPLDIDLRPNAITEFALVPNGSGSWVLESTLNPQYVRVNEAPLRPEKYYRGGASWSDAINEAIAVASDVDRGTVALGSRDYQAASKIILPATKGVRLVMEPRGTITATAAMTALMEKPAGASLAPIVLDNVNLDGASLADATLEVLQSNKFTVEGGTFKNGKVATVDIGRTNLQNYEIHWTGGKVIGRDNTAGKTAADRPLFGIRLSPTCTDNSFQHMIVKNALTLVKAGGQGNIWNDVHCYGYPYKTATLTDDWNAGTVQFDISGYSNRIVNCVADTPEIGFKIAGGLNEVIGYSVLWPSDSRPTNTPVGVDIVAANNIVIGGMFNNPGGANNTGAIGIRIGATAWRPIVIGNQFQGALAGGYVVNMGTPEGEIRGNLSDQGTIGSFTSEKIRNILDIDRGDGNEIIMRWGKGNPGQMIAVGTGATGHVAFRNNTVNGGMVFGATNNYVSFRGKAPAPRELTYSRTGESAHAAQIRQVLAAMGLVDDNTVA